MENERQSIIDALKEKIASLTSTSTGPLLIIEMINYGTAKERKNILRQIKTIVVDVIQNKRKKALVVLLKLILEVDDVVMLNRCVLMPISNNLSQLFKPKENSPIIQLLLTVFSGESKALEKAHATHAAHSTSKKSKEARLEQVGKKMLKEVVRAVKSSEVEALSDSHIAKVMQAVMLFIFECTRHGRQEVNSCR